MKKMLLLLLLMPIFGIAALPNTVNTVLLSAPENTTETVPAEIVPVEPAFVNNAYQIGTAAELKWFEEKTNTATNAGLNKNAVLTADIDYDGNYWIPIAAGDGGKIYTGVFDGAGHTISNLVLSTEWLYNKYIAEGKSIADAKLMIQNSGFIGSLKGTVKNMTLENVTVFSNANGGLKQANPTHAQMIDKPISVGAIVGWISGDNGGGTVDNITVSGNLEAEGIGVALGGIVGNAGGGKILNSTSLVTIKSLTDTSEVYIGGITGYTKNKPVFRNDSWLGEIIVNAGAGSSGGVTGYVYSGTLTVDNVTYNEEGVEDAIGKSCSNCGVSGDLDYGVYKIYTVNGKKICELDGSYKHAVQDGVFTVRTTVDSLILDRKFIPGKSSTFSLPFNISRSNISGAKFYKLDNVVKNSETGKYQVNLVEVLDNLIANKPYIVVVDEDNADSTITIKGSYSLVNSVPSTDYSLDNKWMLESIYNYTTGADQTARGYVSYGFVAKDTVINGVQWHGGQFAKMGPRAYIFPFRVLLDYISEDALQKNAGGVNAMDYNPETIEVVFPQQHTNELSGFIPVQTGIQKTTPRYFKRDNRILIMHNEKIYKINGRH